MNPRSTEDERRDLEEEETLGAPPIRSKLQGAVRLFLAFVMLAVLVGVSYALLRNLF